MIAMRANRPLDRRERRDARRIAQHIKQDLAEEKLQREAEELVEREGLYADLRVEMRRIGRLLDASHTKARTALVEKYYGLWWLFGRYQWVEGWPIVDLESGNVLWMTTEHKINIQYGFARSFGKKHPLLDVGYPGSYALFALREHLAALKTVTTI